VLKDLYERVKRLLVEPRDVLPSTLAESGATKDLLRFVLPLALIGPVVGFLSAGVLGHYQPATSIFNTVIPATYVRSPATAIVGGVCRFVVSVGGWWLFAWILDRLAPQFGARRDPDGARKVAAYSTMPLFLAGGLGIFNSIPHLDWLIYIGYVAALGYGVLIGSYAVPIHCGTPEAKAPGHVFAAILLAVAAVTLAYWILSALLIAPFFLR
jgi:hypothetical protein